MTSRSWRRSRRRRGSGWPKAKGVLDLGLDSAGIAGAPLEIVSSHAGHLWDALCRAIPGSGLITRPEVMRCSEIWCWPGSSSRPVSRTRCGCCVKSVSSRSSYRTVTRRLPVFAKPTFRQSLSATCARHAGLGPASLVLYDVSTLYFETDAGDGFREPGFSKERRLEPQITIGLLTDATGFQLMVPVNAVRITKAHLRTVDSAVACQMSMVTNRNHGSVRVHRRIITPPSMRKGLSTSPDGRMSAMAFRKPGSTGLSRPTHQKSRAYQRL
jgi:hypothetical protein